MLYGQLQVFQTWLSSDLQLKRLHHSWKRVPSHSAIPRHYSTIRLLNEYWIDFLLFVYGRKGLQFSGDLTQSSIQSYRSHISLLKAWRLYAGGNILLAVPVKKSFQTSDCFSDHTSFFKKKPKQNLGTRGLNVWVGLFSWFSSENIHSLIVYQPTDTWQPASLRSTAFGPCSPEFIFSCTAEKPQENYVIVGCQVKFKAKHKLKCKMHFISGSGVPAGWEGLT